MTNLEVVTLLSKNEDDLWEELGKSLGDINGKALFSKDPRQFISQGKVWFQQHLPVIQEYICENSRIKSLLKNHNSIENTHIFILIFEVLFSSNIFDRLHVPLLSAIITNKGLFMLCKTHEKKTS